MTFLETSINRNKTAPQFHSEELIKLIWRNQGPGDGILSIKNTHRCWQRRCLPRTRYSSHGDTPLSSTRRNLLWGVQLADSPRCKQCTMFFLNTVRFQNLAISAQYRIPLTNNYWVQWDFLSYSKSQDLASQPPFLSPLHLHGSDPHHNLKTFSAYPYFFSSFIFLGLTLPRPPKKIFCSLILSLYLPPGGLKLTYKEMVTLTGKERNRKTVRGLPHLPF